MTRRPKLARIVEIAADHCGSFCLYTIDADGANHRLIQQHSYSNRAEREYAKHVITIFADLNGYQYAQPGP